jgi:hypothetical protein
METVKWQRIVRPDLSRTVTGANPDVYVSVHRGSAEMGD